MIDPFAPAVELLGLLRSGETSALDLTQLYLDRIDALNPSINAVIWQDSGAALAEAHRVDGRPDAKRPLLGLPMTVKEAYNLAGSPTTWGDPEYRDNIPRKDALVVQRLKAAGAIIMGKTNVPLNLADLQSYNDIYGVSNNPYNPARTPGGSSGGSAAALAAGLTALEMGSDIGGSIRTPSHFCGLFGHKPTWALVPSRGHGLPGMLAEPDIAVVGPMARSARDLELQLDILAKADDFQPGIRYVLPGLPETGIKDLRVAVWADDQACPVSEETKERVHKVAQALSSLGASVNFEARPRFTGAESDAVYQPLLWAALAAWAPNEQMAQWRKLAANAPADDARDLLEAARAATMSHVDWLHLHHARDRLRWQWHRFFQNYDVLLAPQTPTPAFPHDHQPFHQRSLRFDNQELPYVQQIFWSGLSGISHLPATVIPTGLNAEGLPIGIQIIGNAHSDRLCIQVAQALEAEGFRFEPPPGFAA